MDSSCKTTLGLIATLTLLAGCSSSDDDSATPPAQVGVRFMHASPDAPNVNVEGQLSTFVTDLAYKSASEFLSVGVGNLNVRVDGIVPGGTATVLGPHWMPYKSRLPALGSHQSKLPRTLLYHSHNTSI